MNNKEDLIEKSGNEEEYKTDKSGQQSTEKTVRSDLSVRKKSIRSFGNKSMSDSQQSIPIKAKSGQNTTLEWIKYIFEPLTWPLKNWYGQLAVIIGILLCALQVLIMLYISGYFDE